MHILRGISYGILACSASTVAEARWEKIDEAGATHQEVYSYDIAKDGTNTVTVDHTIDIKLDSARTALGTASFRYNTMTSRIIEVEADITNGGVTRKVGKEHIEDKAERGSVQIFDTVNHVSIAFPNVLVGSRLHYKYTMKVHTVPVADFFAQSFRFGNGIASLPPTRVIYRSQQPLNVTVVDPDHALVVDHHRDGSSDVVEAKLSRAVYYRIINEDHGGYFANPVGPVVHVSTANDWDKIASGLAAPYEVELGKDLPAAFATLADQAKKAQSSFIDRSNAFTAGLADIVRYQGEWHTLKGAHIPRPLATIAESSFGDCKEMSLVTAAALRRMGYKAQVALIERGANPPIDWPLPSLGAFNHAIVRAEDEQGLVHWIDPTNRVSRAQAIRMDIAGRPVLVLDKAHPRLEHTPYMTAVDQVKVIRATWNFRPELEEASLHEQVHLGGFAAENLTGQELNSSKAMIDETLIRECSDRNTVFASQISPYNLKSRVVKDLDFDLTMHTKKSLAETSAGYAFSVPPLYDALGKLDLKNRVSGFALGEPSTSETTYIISHGTLVGEVPAPCEFRSPWLSGERKIEQVGADIVVTRRLQTSAYGIGADELKGDFPKVQDQIKHCLGAYWVVFQISDSRVADVAH